MFNAVLFIIHSTLVKRLFVTQWTNWLFIIWR